MSDSVSAADVVAANGVTAAGSNADLSSTARGGVSDQVADAYLRHGAAVYGLVRNLAGTAAAEQVTVDVFLALARMPRDLSGGTRSLRSWLLALAHRGAVHVLRSDPDRRSLVSATAPSDVERATWDRIGASARDLLSGLSADQRRSIALAYFGGHSCRELATILGQAEDTVKAHLKTGLERLSTAVESGALLE
jgi:RNA polymerase sigma factor (sigma-70 family)